jgi:hypothetical protein
VNESVAHISKTIFGEQTVSAKILFATLQLFAESFRRIVFMVQMDFYLAAA